MTLLQNVIREYQRGELASMGLRDLADALIDELANLERSIEVKECIALQERCEALEAQNASLVEDVRRWRRLCEEQAGA